MAEDYGEEEKPSDAAAAKTGAKIPKSEVGDYGQDVEGETAEVEGEEYKNEEEGA